MEHRRCEITRIVEIQVPVPYSERSPFIRGASPEALKAIDWLRPHFITPDGLIILSIHALLVQAPGVKLIVDTCIGNDKPRGLTLNISTEHRVPAASGGGRGAAREDRLCCLTHLHVDHVGWNTMLVGGKWVPTFPHARYLIGRAEYEHWSSDQSDKEQTEVMGDW